MTHYLHHIFLLLLIASTETAAENRATPNPIIDVDVNDLALKIDRTSPFVLQEVPQKIRKLHGRRVRIRGYMYPPTREDGLTDFILNGETKQKSDRVSAGDIPLHFLIPVTLRAGTTTSYTDKPLVVEGRFAIDPQSLDGKLVCIYKINDAVVARTKARRGYRRSVGFG